MSIILLFYVNSPERGQMDTKRLRDDYNYLFYVKALSFGERLRDRADRQIPDILTCSRTITSVCGASIKTSISRLHLTEQNSVQRPGYDIWLRKTYVLQYYCFVVSMKS